MAALPTATQTEIVPVAIQVIMLFTMEFVILALLVAMPVLTMVFHIHVRVALLDIIKLDQAARIAVVAAPYVVLMEIVHHVLEDTIL